MTGFESDRDSFDSDTAALARAIWPSIRDAGPELTIAGLVGCICVTLARRCTDEQRLAFGAVAIAMIASAVDEPNESGWMSTEVHGHA
jgi:hypothetical protein